MDIKLTDKTIRKFLNTNVSSKTMAEYGSLCGPTFDKIDKIGKEYIFDIEIITNRIDSASAQGVARDLNAILNQQGYKSTFTNNPYKEKIKNYSNFPKIFHFEITDPKLTPRFLAIAFENVNISPSPKEVQNLLTNCGIRPLNNAVDITNELTLLYGLPSHIFDLDKITLDKLTIRESKKGEAITTLDGKKNMLRGEDIVIEDSNGRLIDLCGVMGGQIAEVDNHTKNILLLVPVYDPKKVRKTSLYLQNRSIASQIYEKSPDPNLCPAVLSQAIKLFKDRTGGRVCSKIFDFYPAKTTKQKSISLSLFWLHSFIGIKISSKEISSILKNLGFENIKIKSDLLTCEIPSFRSNDINIKEDLVEEIARVYGYFKLPAILPTTQTIQEPASQLLVNELKAKKFLSNQGATELYNNSLISEEDITKSNLNLQDHLKLQNALSQDFEYLRTHITPSLLQNIKNNQTPKNETFFLFELSNTYQPRGKDKLPDEVSTLGVVSNTSYHHHKGHLETLFEHLNIKVSFSKSIDQPPYFDSQNTAQIISGNKTIGYLGQINATIQRNYQIKNTLIATEINFQLLTDQIQDYYTYTPISEYPEITEDITIESDKPIGDIIQKIKNTDPLIKSVEYIESFKNKHTFEVSFSSQEKNLTQEDIAKIRPKLTT